MLRAAWIANCIRDNSSRKDVALQDNYGPSLFGFLSALGTSLPATTRRYPNVTHGMMTGGPGITKLLDSYPATADNTRKPYIMFGGTPYEHVMFPVQ